MLRANIWHDPGKVGQIELRHLRLGDVDWSQLMCARDAPHHWLDEVTQLDLVDCTGHGDLMPYLAYLPMLRSLAMNSFDDADPLESEMRHRPPSTGFDRPSMCAPPSPSSPSPTIRVLDFLTLAECRYLTTVWCSYELIPLPNSCARDPQLSDVPAILRELHRRRRVRFGAHSAPLDYNR